MIVFATRHPISAALFPFRAISYDDPDRPVSTTSVMRAGRSFSCIGAFKSVSSVLDLVGGRNGLAGVISRSLETLIL